MGLQKMPRRSWLLCRGFSSCFFEEGFPLCWIIEWGSGIDHGSQYRNQFLCPKLVRIEKACIRTLVLQERCVLFPRACFNTHVTPDIQIKSCEICT